MPVSISMSRFTGQTVVLFRLPESGKFWRCWTVWMLWSNNIGRQGDVVVLEASQFGIYAYLPGGFDDAARVDAVADPAREGLAGKAIGHRHDGFGLEALLFESEVHGLRAT